MQKVTVQDIRICKLKLESIMQRTSKYCTIIILKYDMQYALAHAKVNALQICRFVCGFYVTVS